MVVMVVAKEERRGGNIDELEQSKGGVATL